MGVFLSISAKRPTAENDLFMKENGRSLTGAVQGYAEVGGHSMILVDNSTAGQDKVEIVNFGNWKSEATLTARPTSKIPVE